MKNNRKINISIINTSFVIGLSRITGFLRELVLSFFIGTSSIMDAFVIAYMIPNFFRRILGEKAAESVFIPMYTRQREISKQKADEYMSKLFTILGILLILLVILFYPLASFLIKIIAPGFDNTTFSISLKITYLILPYMFFIGIYAFLGALLESHKKFFLYNISPFVFNTILIFAIVLFYNRISFYALALGIMLGVICQTLILFFHIKKLNINFRIIFDMDNNIKKTGRLLLPIIAGSGIEKLSTYIDRIMASLLPIGSISALYYAFRLIDLPFAVFSIAIGKVLHPYISSKEIYKNKKLFKKYIMKGFLLNIMILLPLSIIFAIFSKQFVMFVFMRGSFNIHSVSITAFSLLYYSIGLLPMGIISLFSRAFYSLLDTITPLKIALFSSIINVILNIILMPILGIGGLALGTSISLWFNAIYLIILLYNKVNKNENR